MEHIDYDTLGNVLKSARKAKGLTREQLSEAVNITPRYLMSIENEHKKPSYTVLFHLIRELGISADVIFYPELEMNSNDRENLIKMMYICGQHEINVVAATIDALLHK